MDIKTNKIFDFFNKSRTNANDKAHFFNFGTRKLAKYAKGWKLEKPILKLVNNNEIAIKILSIFQLEWFYF